MKMARTIERVRYDNKNGNKVRRYCDDKGELICLNEAACNET